MDAIVIVGGGQAGAALAAKLRALGHKGAITLIGAEAVLPYQRPPLTKKYLTGEMPLERLLLRPAQFYADNGIDLILGAEVRALDPAARQLTLVDGRCLSWDQLALTTGAFPRRLPAAIGGDLAGVYLARDLADADAMAPEFEPGRRVLIVGGGYIGLEAAAVAAGRGLSVTLVEAAGRILQRVAAPETSEWFRALHRRHGVEILEGAGLARLLDDGAGRVRGAVLADGREIAADFVIAGIGIAPATDLAQAAGIALDNGIATDALGRTSASGVWAAGDCASFPWQGVRIRLESVQNAIDQAECVAANMLGAGQAYVPQPWFWSDQYDVKLQIAGLNAGHDRVVPRLGAQAPGEGPASFWYFRAGKLIAVDAMNDPRAYMVGKRLIEGGITPPEAALADPASDLRALLRLAA